MGVAARRVAEAPAPAAWRARAAALAGPLAIAIVGIVMLARTWGTWPDVIVDFGRELYLAWRLAEGDTLYVDVSHFSGPLSPYLNALWFRIFGVGLWTLAMANLALAVGFVALLYDLLARLAGRLAATAACLVFVTLFACAQYTVIGNYNWICPYSHELTHGVMLVVGALWCLERYHRTRGLVWLGLLGFAMGLVVLTKAEVLLAGGGAAAIGMGLTAVVERPSPGRAARMLAGIAGGAAIPLLVVMACFAGAMPFDEVLRWPLGHWHTVARPELSATGFYQAGMGLADLTTNLTTFGTAALGYVALAIVATAAAFALREVPAPPPVVVGATFLVTVVGLGGLVGLDAWVHEAPRPLPLFVGLVAAFFVVEAVRRRDEPARAFDAVLAAALCTFGLLLLAKMIFKVRLLQYGFVLAMPATMALVVAMVEWLPAAVGRAGGRAAVVRAVALGALVAAVLPQLGFMDRLIGAKVHRAGQGADAFWADGRAQAVVALVQQVRAQVGPGETLVGIPEGAMINYLARRRNPTPYYIFDRTTLALWGEAEMVRALDVAAPDWVAFVDRGGDGSGRPFGIGVAGAAYDWAISRYAPVWRRGVPFDGGRGARVSLLRRRDE